MKKISARTLLASWCIIWSLCLIAVLWQADMGSHISGISKTGKKLGSARNAEMHSLARTGGTAGGR